MDNKRNTLQRQLILNAVRELKTHATAEEVYEYIIDKNPSISKSTVYRNLNQMSEAGDILSIGSFYGSMRYDHRCHSHYHFICEECKGIFDGEGDLSYIIDKFNFTDGFEITSCNLTFGGICQGCKDSVDGGKWTEVSGKRL